MSFKQLLSQRLSERDKEYNQYHDFIVTNQRLLQQTIEYKNRIQSLERSSQSSVRSPQQYTKLDRQIRDSNQERTEMYKTHGENALRLVRMNERLRIKEEKDRKQTKELENLSEAVKALHTKHDSQVQQLREKDVAIQALQDEFSTLQLQLTTAEERNIKLNTENKQLITRWLMKMNEEAEKMNEATQFYESALQQARSRKNITSITAITEIPEEVERTIDTDDQNTYCIAVSTAGSILATGGGNKKLQLWDTKTGRIVRALSGATQAITSVSFNSTDELVLGTSADNAIRIWSTTSHRIKHTLAGHIGKVYAAKFTQDSNKVVSGSHDRTLKVWDLQKGHNIRTIFTYSSCNDLCLIDPEGQTVVSGHLDSNVRIWDLRSGSNIKELAGIHTGQITSVSTSPDGHMLLTSSRDNTLKMIDIRMYDIVRSFQAESYHNGLNWSRSTFSPDGRHIASGSKDGKLHIWSVKTGRLERVIKGPASSTCGVLWNKRLYSAGSNGIVSIWS